MASLEEKIAHLQAIQDNYVGPILGIASSLFCSMPKARMKIANGGTGTYQKTVLLIKKSLREIQKIAKEAILASKI